MKKAPLYSRSRQTSKAPELPAPADVTPPPVARGSRLGVLLARHERRLWAVALLTFAAFMALQGSQPSGTPALTMKQIDAAMRTSIEDTPLTSPATRAFETILPSVVRVLGLMTEGDDGSDTDEADDGKKHPSVERGVGTGVVIIDNGTILTNLHVVQGAKRIKVMFMDGTDSEAVVVGSQPHNDLAVLRAKTIPDDLEAATMRSTADLSPGDQVLAVGFPFGIGPSASAGVVSGLRREFRSPEGKQTLTNLIQFDAAANPGNSGGPLVTMDGAVVGIVTAILNPSKQRTFIGIGFAVPIENAATAAGMPPF